MLRRSSLSVVLFTLLLTWPTSSGASSVGAPARVRALFSDKVADKLSEIATSLQDHHGYALTARLDEVVQSQRFTDVMVLALNELDQRGPEELNRATLEFEFDQLYTRLEKAPNLRVLLSRTYAATIGTFELLSNEELVGAVQEALVEIDRQQEKDQHLLDIDSLEMPAESKRHLWQIFRGSAAMMSLPFVGHDGRLRKELLGHAAIGAETNARYAAAMISDRARAREILADLRLEPIDLEALERRQSELEAGRESLKQARKHIASFQLPPDPSFET